MKNVFYMNEYVFETLFNYIFFIKWIKSQIVTVIKYTLHIYSYILLVSKKVQIRIFVIREYV